MKRVILIGILTTATIWAVTPRATFADHDLNGDGKVTQEEFQKAQADRMKSRADEGRQMRNAANAAQFADIDTNKDGVVTPSEYKVYQQKRMNTNMKNRRGNNNRQGMNRGQGRGQGMGRGQGRGQGMNRP